jgi:uncharacterized Rmd1/YagE family protein
MNLKENKYAFALIFCAAIAWIAFFYFTQPKRTLSAKQIIELNPACDTSVSEPFKLKPMSEFPSESIQLLKDQGNSDIFDLYTCATWLGTLAQSEIGSIATSSQTIIDAISKEYGLVNIWTKEFGTQNSKILRTIVKTARAPLIVVDTEVELPFQTIINVVIRIKTTKM